MPRSLVRVITPPAPFLEPSELIGGVDNALTKSMIGAAIEQIDGPTGWLGQCLAPQLLEWSLDRWPSHDKFDWPIGPVIEIDSVKYVDVTGAEQIWPHGDPIYFEGMPTARGRQGDIRIRYWAGYGARNISDPVKWDEAVPQRVKMAVTLTVQHLMALGAENLFLRSEDVEGVGVTSYTVSDQASNLIQSAAEHLLSGLRVYRI